MLQAMIVDDYEYSRAQLKTLDVWGESTQFSVFSEATNGADALNKLYEHPVDLLITDIRMPVIDGIELLKKAREEKLCNCVILMSQFNDFEYARQGISNGAFEYLLKPISREDLLKVLDRASRYVEERKQDIKKYSQVNKIDYIDSILVKKLISSIKEGSFNAVPFSSQVIEDILSGESQNIIQILEYLNLHIIETVQKNYSWIGKFVDLQKILNLNYSSIYDIHYLKNAYEKILEEIISTIRKFEITEDGIIRKTCTIILEDIDSEISLKTLSEQLFITKTYLSQLFKSKTGINLINYVTFVKMERAKILLADKTIKIHKIAEILAYKDIEYFSKLFKKNTGITPTDYRASVLNL